MFGVLQSLLVWALSAATLAACAWGLIDAARRPEAAFTSAGKWSKTIWLIILGVATALAFISMPALPFLNILGANGGGVLWFGGLAAIVAAAIYFADVRPKLGSGGFGSSGGSRGRSSGGW
ncbi:DUF2516 family protein [Demequina mangrovi]|uniref:DUF2516 family protein n=1 Tax=Demequina mangrovi TaxID=1043493 RepID=A0A1H6VYH4_9MICO|nr:DUF2516 family protein [Demequina mangrovi]SEJ09728.1 Protein of unknown function [Demequina mangrovi]